jgi:tetratricopeptide (TPR) repeat protein/tRNA A-37 threonylcarbamoyl transferase component Bud32
VRQIPEALAQQIGDRYRLDRAVGEGGMATVYLAHDDKIDRAVVVKVMRPDLVASDSAKRFLREIQVTARLQHPQILPLLDSGIAAGTSYYVVPFVAGGSLRDRLEREGALPTDVLVRVVSDVADALDYAHANGVIHRDIKPENILLEGDRAIVADFGVARAVDEVSGTRLTSSGIALGTPAYMSPEHSESSKADARSDLYSLGCVLYEMLSGHTPFGGRTPQEVLARHAVDPIPPIRSARPDLSTDVEAVVAKALAKAPADRYQNGRSFAEALATAIAKGPEAAPRRQRRWLVAGGAAAVVAGVGFLSWYSTTEAAFQSRDWVVVADLASEGADSVASGAVRSALILALQQSRYVNVQPASVIAQTLRMMTRPDTTRLTEAVAREVALRQGTRAVLVPSMTRLDSTYVLGARLVSTQSGANLMTLQERANGRAHLLDALDRLAVGIRKELGERLRDAEPVVGIARATTSSLEALQAWTRGTDAFRGGRFGAAMDEFQAAISLDPDFAMAHKSLGVAHYWQNRRDTGDAHFERALALSDRMTERERLLVRAEVAGWRQQTDNAIVLYQQFLTQYPDDIGAHGSLGFSLMMDGRWADALEQYEWLGQRDSSNANTRINLATINSALRRYAESLRHYRAAFAIQPSLARSGNNVVHEYGQTLVSAGQLAAAESLFRTQVEGDPQARARATRSLGLLAVYRGQSAVARDLFRQALAQNIVLVGVTSEMRDRLFLARTLMEVGKLDSARQLVLETVDVLRKRPVDAGWLEHPGRIAALLGMDSVARNLEREFAARVQPGNRGDQVSLHRLRGTMALKRGDFATARDHFEAALAITREPTALGGLARALIGQGQSRQAEQLYQELIATGSNMYEPVYEPFEARLGLARLAITRGDRAAAREHLTWLLTTWKTGDKDLVMRREAENLLASLDRSSP